MNVKYRYIYEDVDRHGNVRIYFWRGKGHRKVRLREKVGSPEFHREYQALAEANAARELREPKIKLPAPNTFLWLCLKFFDSTDFKLLDPKTQQVRRQVLEHTWNEPIAPGANEKFGDFPLSRMTAKAVRVLRNRKSGFPEAANVRIKAIRRVFIWAMENEIANITSNPARDVAYIRNRRVTTHGPWPRLNNTKKPTQSARNRDWHLRSFCTPARAGLMSSGSGANMSAPD